MIMEYKTYTIEQISDLINNMMINIPGGDILLNDDRKKTKWSVNIMPFQLAQYPVTQEIYYSMTHEAPSTFKGYKNPVETISWIEAVNFCNLLSQKMGLDECYYTNNTDENVICNWESNGFRLPTEAEWEYACKAGKTDVIYGELENIAWYGENSDGKTHEVGQKEPNAWQLYDMLGNVWEWCWDIYDQQVYGSYRVFRGGGWSDPARGCLATNRRRSHPTFKIDDLGLRLARRGS